MNTCDCLACVVVSLKHPGLDFLMWRVELGWPTVSDTDLAKAHKLYVSSTYGKIVEL